MAREGAMVIVNYASSQKEAEETAAAIQAGGGQAEPLKASVIVEADVKLMVQQVLDRYGRLDVLVNNAGWSKRTPHAQLDDLTEEIWDRTLNTNLRGTFYCSRTVAPVLKRFPGSSIVNISSVAPYTGEGSSIVYAASKAGVISMTKSFARILAPDVRVNCIAPGFVKTRFAGWPAEAFEEGARMAPLKRIATAEEIGLAAVFLAADATSMTGETIRIDSGIIALRRG
jgi:3-oxoacyl-[acyl-carrier protein] reductase